MTVEVDAQRIYGELSQLREAVESLRERIEFFEQKAHPSIRTEHPHEALWKGSRKASSS